MSYKIIKQDDKSYHMLHPDGSTFQVAKKGLGPDILQHIEKNIPLYMNGGGVAPPIPPDPSQGLDSLLAGTANASSADSGAPTFKAAGTTDPTANELDVKDLTDKALLKASIFYGGVDKIPPQVKEQAMAQSKFQVFDNPTIPTPTKEPVVSDLIHNDEAPKPNLDVKMPAANQTDYSLLGTTKAINDSILKKGEAEASAKKKEAEALGAYQNDLQVQAARTQAQYDNFMAKSADLEKRFMDKTLDPNRVWNNMGTGNKILAGVSMLLGGLGASANGGKNVASEAIDQMIDRDIDAQKQEILKNKELFANNERGLQHLMAWDADQRSTKLAAVNALIQQTAAASGSPIAKANAQIAVQENNQKIAQLAQQMSVQQAALQGADPVTAKIELLLPKEQREQAHKEYSEYRAKEKSLNNVDDIFKRYEDVQTASHRIAHPIASREEVGALNAELVNAVMEASGVKRISEEFAKKLVEPFEVGVKDDHKEVMKKLSSIRNIIKVRAGEGAILPGRGWLPNETKKVAFNPTK